MNAADILKYGQLTVLQTLDGFPETEWETPGACGYGSVKDILAHLTSYERVLVDILASFTTGGPMSALGTFVQQNRQFNDSEVDRRKGKSIQDVLTEFNDTHAQVMSLIAGIAPEKLREVGTLPWYGAAYSLDDVLVYMYYGHKREHSAQIAVFGEVLKQR